MITQFDPIGHSLFLNSVFASILTLRFVNIFYYFKFLNMEGYKEGHLYFASESVGEGHPDKLCD